MLSVLGESRDTIKNRSHTNSECLVILTSKSFIRIELNDAKPVGSIKKNFINDQPYDHEASMRKAKKNTDKSFG